MKLTYFAATLAVLIWGAAPAFAGPDICPEGGAADADGDTILDCADNCSDVANTDQYDVDGDLCGNRCDADFDQGGTVTTTDLSNAIINGYGTTQGVFDVQVPHDTQTGGIVTTTDLSDAIINHYGSPPGPSGTTTGTTACP